MRFYNWLSKQETFKRLPQPIRHSTNRLYNWLLQYDHLDYLRSQDPNEGLGTISLPEGEKVSLPAIWVCEMYPPSYAEALKEAIKRNGWHNSSHRAFPEEVKDYLDHARTEAGLGWRAIVRIRSKRALNSPSFGTVRKKLPKEFESIGIDFFSLGSALSAVIATFTLSEDAASSLERIILGPHEPRVVRDHGFTRVEDRYARGMDEVHEVRRNLHQTAREWMSFTIPGVFASEADKQMPAADLVIRYGSSETQEYRDKNRGYLAALGLDEIVESSCDELPGIFIMNYRPIRTANNVRDTWSLNGEFASILDDDDFASIGGERTISGIIHRVDETFKPLLTRLAISSLLQLKMRLLAISRDIASSTYGHHPVRSSKLLRKSLLRNSLDLLEVAGSVRVLATDENMYAWSVPSFRSKYSRWLRSIDERTETTSPPYDARMIDELREFQLRTADLLVARDGEARDILGTVVTLNSSIDNIRSQRLTLIFTFITALIAILALLATRSTG
jgi:hypothetical protein